MSAGEINDEEIITSNSECMELSESDMKFTQDELKIVSSQITNDVENKVMETESISPVEISLKLNTDNGSTIDTLGTPRETHIIQVDSAPEIIEIKATDIKNEVKSMKIGEIADTVIPTEVNDIVKTTNLTESTFGLITEDPEISKSDLILRSLDEIQSTEQSSTAASNKVSQLDEQLDKNLSIGQKKDVVVRVDIKNTVNSLFSLAAEYASSDSDDDERISSPTEIITIVDDADYRKQNNTQYRITAVHDDSVSEDSDSDSDESSDDSSDDSDTESDSEIEVEDGLDQVSKTQPTKIKKIKNEYEDLPPIEELKITVAEELCDRLGEVSGIVEQLVIVRPISGKPTLNLDSVLFLEKGHRVLGQVFDVFGQVADPHYCVRFNSEEHITKSGIKLGMEVYYSPTTEHTSLVFLHELVKLKGVDVSGEDAIEPPEFSDDEEERAYNQLQRQKQRQKPGMTDRQENSDSNVLPQKRQCHSRQRNPWSSDWQSRNYSNQPPNRNFNQGPPRWSSVNSHPPFQNSYNLRNPVYPANQPPSNQYGQPNGFDVSQYQFNSYNNPYQQNNLPPAPNSGYVFGRPPGFRPNFNNYGPNLYRPDPYQPPSMSWTPPPPPPPPSSM